MFDDGGGKRDKGRVNPKRWFIWLCLVLLLAGDGFLFIANQQKNAAQTDLRNAQQQVGLLQSQLDRATLSSVTEQSNENDRLRRENKKLSDQLKAMQSAVLQMNETNGQMSAELEATRELAQEQQQQLAQLQPDNPQMATANSADAERNECLNNLRQIDAAKNQWALENNKTTDAVPTVQDLLPYFRDGIFPVCPSGGTYTIGAVGELPTCSIPGHVLPQ